MSFSVFMIIVIYATIKTKETKMKEETFAGMGIPVHCTSEYGRVQDLSSPSPYPHVH